MVAPSPSWNLVRIYGKWLGQDGALKAGSYSLRIPARITNATDDSIIPAGTFAVGALQTVGVRSLDILAPATDDPDNNETGWKVNLEISFTEGAGELYVIDVPYAARPVADGGTGAGIDLRTVVLAASIPQQTALYRVGVAGGLATLNSAGQVVDAAGNPVLDAAQSSSAQRAANLSDLASPTTARTNLGLGTAAMAAATAFDAAGAAASAQTTAQAYTDTRVAGAVQIAYDTDGVPYLL